MKRFEKVILIILIVVIGICLIGIAIKDSKMNRHVIPNKSHVTEYHLKDSHQLESINTVPIHHQKWGNLKPHFIHVYAKEGDKIEDITKYGTYQPSDKAHQFGSWKPRIKQDKLKKIIHHKDIYFKVSYEHDIDKWYKIDNIAI